MRMRCVYSCVDAANASDVRAVTKFADDGGYERAVVYVASKETLVRFGQCSEYDAAGDRDQRP